MIFVCLTASYASSLANLIFWFGNFPESDYFILEFVKLKAEGECFESLDYLVAASVYRRLLGVFCSGFSFCFI